MSVNEILSKERTESPVSPQEGKGSKGIIIFLISYVAACKFDYYLFYFFA